MARGIDIPNAGLVISVFVPRYNNRDKDTNLDGFTYMHRTARTGRHSKYGISLTYLRG